MPIPYERLWPAQQQFLKMPYNASVDICCYQGGYGSGKTFIGSLLGLLLCFKHPGICGLVIGKTYPLVRDTTLQSYFQHLEAMGLFRDKDFYWHATEHKLRFSNGSFILFRHIAHPDKLKSLNCGWIEIEEMGMLSEADFLMLLSRLRQPGIPKYRLFGHTNPQPGKGWIYKYFVENAGNQGKTVCYRRIIAPTLENKALPEAYISNMSHTFDDAYYQMNVLGQDTDLNNQKVCPQWSDANMEATPYRPELRLYLSCDFNVDPMSWVFAHRFNGEYHFVDELCAENCTTREAAERVFQRYGTHRTGLVITGDASGNNRSSKGKHALETDYTILRNTLSSLGMANVSIDIRSKNPPVHSRIAAWNAFVCNNQGVRRIKVNPACKRLIENCEALSYIPGTSDIRIPTVRQIERNPEQKFVKHIFDAASYLVERYDPIRLEAPIQNNYTLRYKPFTPKRR
jgi:hypothetical protein